MYAVIYARISSDQRGDAAGVNRQVQDCKQFVTEHGWDLADVYVDNDVSAYSGRPRPQYRRLCEDIKAGGIDVVVAWHPDRLHRRPIELEEFINLIEAHHVGVHTITAGYWDLSNPSGKLVARNLGAVARYESEHKSERITRKMAERAQEGKAPAGGARPYGYERGRIAVVEHEAAVIREAALRLLANEALYSVCTDFNERGLASSTGSPWTTSTMRRMMMSAHLSAQREYHGEVVATANWEAIITPNETARLKALFSDPARRTTRAARSYPLHGLLYCGLCDGKLHSRPASDGRRQYGCLSGTNFNGCGKIRITSEPIEQLIAEAVLLRLDSPELHRMVLAEAARDTEAAAAQNEVAGLAGRLETMIEAYGRGDISWGEYMAGRKTVTELLDHARATLNRLSNRSALEGFVGRADELRGQWASLPLTRQRAIVEALVERIEVHAANRRNPRFDPARVKAIWRA